MPEAERRKRESRRVSPWPYVAMGLFIIGLPLAGYFGATWRVYLKRVAAAEHCFAAPARALDDGGTGTSGVAFSPDGRTLLSSCHGRGGWTRGIVIHWEAETGKELGRVEWGGGTAGEVAFTPDGQTAIVGGCDSGLSNGQRSVLRLWALGSRGWSLPSFRGSLGGTYALALSPDGATVLTADSRETLLWDLGSGKIIRRFGGARATVWAVAFFPGGERIVTGEDYGRITVWSVADGEKLQSFRAPSGESGGVLALSPDGQLLLSGNIEGEVRLWDPRSGEELGRLRRPRGRVNAAVFLPQGRYVLTAGQDGSGSGKGRAVIRLWDVRTRRLIARFADPLQEEKIDESSFFSLAVSPDGRRVAAGYWWRDAEWDHHGRAYLWEIPDERGLELLRRRGGVRQKTQGEQAP